MLHEARQLKCICVHVYYLRLPRNEFKRATKFEFDLLFGFQLRFNKRFCRTQTPGYIG